MKEKGRKKSGSNDDDETRLETSLTPQDKGEKGKIAKRK